MSATKEELLKQCPEDFFPSLGEFLDTLSDLPGEGDKSHGEWSGGSFDDGMQLARYGWPEGAKEAAQRVDSLARRLVTSKSALETRTEIVMDVCGGAFDMGAYMAGEPECWIAFQPQESKKAIRIVCNVGVSAGVETAVIQQRGHAMTALVLALQAAGHPVTVDVCHAMHAEYNNASRLAVIRVADASSGSPLDVDRLAYALSHPSMLRCLGFAFIEKRKNAGFAESIGWARREDHKGVSGDLKPLTGEPIDLYFGAAHLSAVERWKDGGDNWILDEYLRQTKEG